MDYSTIRLIRQRVLKDLETCIPSGSYKWNDTSQERIAGLDLAIGFEVYARNDNDQPFLSPRQRAAGVVLMLIGRHRLGCRDAQSDGDVAKGLEAKLAEFQLALERYLQHVEPGEAKPIRAAIAGQSTTATGAGTVMRSKQRAQEQRIRELISEAGHRADDLPPRKKGTRGVKAQIRALALRQRDLFSYKSFDLAWGRLRHDRELVGGE